MHALAYASEEHDQEETDHLLLDRPEFLDEKVLQVQERFERAAEVGWRELDLSFFGSPEIMTFVWSVPREVRKKLQIINLANNAIATFPLDSFLSFFPACRVVVLFGNPIKKLTGTLEQGGVGAFDQKLEIAVRAREVPRRGSLFEPGGGGVQARKNCEALKALKFRGYFVLIEHHLPLSYSCRDSDSCSMIEYSEVRTGVQNLLACNQEICLWDGFELLRKQTTKIIMLPSSCIT